MSSRRGSSTWKTVPPGGPVPAPSDCPDYVSLPVDTNGAMIRQTQIRFAPVVAKDGTATVQSDAPGPFAPLLGSVNWRGLRLTAHAVLGNLAKQPEGTVTLSGSADDLVVAALDGRLPGFGRTTLDAKVGVQADGSLTLDALNATTAASEPARGTRNQGTWAAGSRSAVEVSGASSPSRL